MNRWIFVSLFLVVGCGDAKNARESGSCCIVNGSTYCASESVEVQWNNMYWSTEDAGACPSGQSCTAYSASPGDLQPIGNGVCE